VKRVAVIGGGFGGVAAACRLAGDGHQPILFERTSRLGGRAASYVDGETGTAIDYGHHVLMSCCTATRGFLARIGASDAVRFQPELRIPILCGGHTTFLRSSLLPGPAHLAPSLLGYQSIPLRDRLGVLRAGAALLFRRGNPGESFGVWLERHGQSEASVERLWNPISLATLNAPADRVCVSTARQVFREGFFTPGGANMGLFTRPLSEIFDSAQAYIERRESEVRTRVAVARILLDKNVVRAVELADGEAVACDTVVPAVPPDALRRLLGNTDGLTEIADRASRLEWSPIVDVHLWFDRPVMKEPFAMSVDAPIQAIFDVSADSRVRVGEEPVPGSSPRPDRPKKGQSAAHIVVSQSAATDWLPCSSEEIGDLVLDALRRLLPGMRNADCLRRRVIKHPRATFVSAPGSDALRPRTKTPIEGLFLAGDWTATGWPSTIEGAIRSGVTAAAQLDPPCEKGESLDRARPPAPAGRRPAM